MFICGVGEFFARADVYNCRVPAGRISMAGDASIPGITTVLLLVMVIAAGCAAPLQQSKGPPRNISVAGAGGTGQHDGIDLRYTLSPPVYMSSDWIENRQWTAGILIMNAGTVAADGYCINVSLVRNTTGEVVDSRYVQFSCGMGCIAPGTSHKDVVTFRPGWQQKGYYGVTGGSCGGEWPPVLPAG